MCFDSNVSSALRPIGQGARQFAERHRRAAAGAHDLAVDDIEIGGARLHELGGSGKRLVAQLHCRKPCRLATHHGDARGEGAHALVDAVGLAVDDAHADVIDAKRVGADLRHRRLHALADRGDAGNHLDGAVVCDLDAHGVERAEPAFLHEHRKAGADCFAAPRAVCLKSRCSSSQSAAASALSSRPA